MSGRKVYLSGPISADPLGTQHARWAFGETALGVERRGDVPVNPFDVPACNGDTKWNAAQSECESPDGKHHSWGCYLKHDLVAMLLCDEVQTLPGWQNSRGALLEVGTALNVGMVVYLA